LKNPKVDELLDKGRVETDPEKRRAIYNEVQKIVTDEIPLIYVCYLETVSVYNKRIKGVPAAAVSGDNIFKTVYKWSVE
jgi:peptide/nickel transport system substrate-binding protein